MSWDGVARSLGCGKATVSKCAARMRESGIGAAELEGMTDADVSALFEDGRSRRSEGYLEPDYERVCDQLARVPKMTLALQWARYAECNPGGKRLYQYSQFCRLVGDYARTHDLAARSEHEPGAHDARRLGGRHRLDLRPRDGQALPRIPVRGVLPVLRVNLR